MRRWLTALSVCLFACSGGEFVPDAQGSVDGTAPSLDGDVTQSTGVRYRTIEIRRSDLACDAADAPGQPSYAGCVRSYFVYVPARYATEPGRRFPLVLALHGNGQDAARMMGGTDFDGQLDANGAPLTDDHSGLEGRLNELADVAGFIPIYPNGSPRSTVGYKWSDCRADVTAPDTASGADDVGFIRRVVDDVTHLLPGADEGAVFALGYSNGGEMVTRLYFNDAEASGALTIKGFAVIEADFPYNRKPDCQSAPSTPRGVLVFQGDVDNYMAYSDSLANSPKTGIGNSGTDDLVCGAPQNARETTCSRGLLWDAPGSIAQWQQLTGSATPLSTRTLGDDPSITDNVTLSETRYSGSSAPLWVVHQIGGGHTIPGAHSLSALYSAALGPKDLDFGYIDTGVPNDSTTAPTHPDGAADLVWKFFSSL